VELVARERQEVDWKPLKVYLDLANRLGGICVERYAGRSAYLTDCLNWLDHSGLVVDPLYGNDSGLRSERLSQLIEVDVSSGVYQKLTLVPFASLRAALPTLDLELDR
jgi:hypothetical protein